MTELPYLRVYPQIEPVDYAELIRSQQIREEQLPDRIINNYHFTTADATEAVKGSLRLAKPSSFLRGTATRPLKGFTNGWHHALAFPRSGNAGIHSIGCVASITGTRTVAKDADGFRDSRATAATSNTTATAVAAECSAFGTIHGHASFFRFKTGSSIAVMRILVGLNVAQWGNADDNPNSLYFLYNPATSANWLMRSGDAASAVTSVNSGVAVAAATIYQCLIEVPEGGGNPTFTLYDKSGASLAATTISTNLPDGVLDFNAEIQLRTLEAVSKSIEIGSIEVQAQ